MLLRCGGRGPWRAKLYEVVLHSDELAIEVHKTVGFRTAVFDLSPVPPELVSAAYLRWLLDSALHANINLIRIWGGGSYPSQEFLSLCDQLGIMVWMDAMFAAPSIPFHSFWMRGRYDNYTKGELHGTGEHYGYDASKAFDIDTYPRSRFMVEFGMFSLPSIYTLDRILTPLPQLFDQLLRPSCAPQASASGKPHVSLFCRSRPERTRAAATYFFSPPLTSPPPRPRQVLHRWSYSSQLFQSSTFQPDRRLPPFRAQPARNRGLIVWQLNDVWEGTSWSSIEYGGRWKMLHYALAKVQSQLP
ncbi:uncharacterized protein UTRI_02402 [Ustilago trichophora]|uniref:Beta-mannosidase n=1 Tax=Ustilago trichophora TaxID=86804 RepID=A0A5C3E991_9BASI|nr:uncharacterized protein UTRI_02402 [Ustilago trichophora]